MIKIVLGHEMIDCPQWWENFIHDLQQRVESYDDVPMRTINQELKKYSARCRYLTTDTRLAVEFDSEQNYTLFALRWS